MASSKHTFSHFWCVVCAVPSPSGTTTPSSPHRRHEPTNQQSNQQSNQQRIIEILKYLISYISSSIILEHRIIDLSWPEDCCCFPMYRPSRLRWAADKWGTNPCCCGSRTGTCGHNHRTSQHAHLSDVARKKLSGRSRQEEVVRKKSSSGSCSQESVSKQKSF